MDGYVYSELLRVTTPPAYYVIFNFKHLNTFAVVALFSNKHQGPFTWHFQFWFVHTQALAE